MSALLIGTNAGIFFADAGGRFMKNYLFDKNKKYRSIGMFLIGAAILISVLLNVRFQSVSEHNREQQSIVEDYQGNASGQMVETADSDKSISDTAIKSVNPADESSTQSETNTKQQNEAGTKSNVTGSDMGNTDTEVTQPATNPATEPASKDNTPEYVNFTFAIKCAELSNNIDKWSNKIKPSSVVPTDGIVLAEIQIKLKAGSSVYDALRYAAALKNITYMTQFGSDYVTSIANISEKDAGTYSGWMYYVNNTPPNVSCSNYKIAEGDHIVWDYSVFAK